MLLAIGVSDPVAAQEAETFMASGTITQSGKTLHLKSAIAVWDNNQKAIIIGLFPFEAGQEDVGVVLESGVQALAALRPSPDESVWPKTPVGGIIIRYKKRPKDLVLKDVRKFSVRASWLGDQDKSFAMGRATQQQLAEEITEFDGSLTRVGGRVRLLAAGSGYLSGETFDWNIRVDATIHTAKKK
jgi:hypothetical protein